MNTQASQTDRLHYSKLKISISTIFMQHNSQSKLFAHLHVNNYEL